MKAPPGAVVSIYYDSPGLELGPGHALVTRTGRAYLIVEARRQARGAHAGRWHLRAAVHEGPLPRGVVVHPLYWYKRGRGAK